jgi:hypothetical protein
MSLKKSLKKIAKKAKPLLKKIVKPLAVVAGVGLAVNIGATIAKANAKKKKLAAIAKTAQVTTAAPENIDVVQTAEGTELINDNITPTAIEKKPSTMLYVIIAAVLLFGFMFFGKKSAK